MSQTPSHELKLTPTAVLLATLGISAVLVLLHLIGLYLRFGLDHDYVFGFVPLFDLGREQNVPTLINSVFLIGIGAMCIFAGKLAVKWRWRWWLIAVVFLILGIDETFGLHEPVFFVLRGNQSVGTAAWVGYLGGLRWLDLLPWLLAIGMVLVGWYWSFLSHVGSRISIMAISSAALYLLGAAGIDYFTSVEFIGNIAPLKVAAIETLEEVLELVGASLMIYCVMCYLAEKHRIGIRLNH